MRDNFLDDVFDFNNDGEIDSFETSIGEAFLEIEAAELDPDDYGLDDDDWDDD